MMNDIIVKSGVIPPSRPGLKNRLFGILIGKDDMCCPNVQDRKDGGLMLAE